MAITKKIKIKSKKKQRLKRSKQIKTHILQAEFKAAAVE